MRKVEEVGDAGELNMYRRSFWYCKGKSLLCRIAVLLTLPIVYFPIEGRSSVSRFRSTHNAESKSQGPHIVGHRFTSFRANCVRSWIALPREAVSPSPARASRWVSFTRASGASRGGPPSAPPDLRTLFVEWAPSGCVCGSSELKGKV